ncbi:MAG TPA: hypothetical protein VHP14_09390 [Anaerolineales bacterium]|nr:hypothetical protein [Anaerolineales bacterium]
MTEEEKRPIPESYWVVPGHLLAGEHPAQFDEEVTRRRLDALLEAGFDTFIDLTRPNETFPYHLILPEEAKASGREVVYQRFSIGDFGLPTPEQMNALLAAIEEGLHAGRKIYLHCWGGIGRTGTTVGCYLVRQGMTGAEALEQLAVWWRNVPKSRHYHRSPETPAQADFIRNWSQFDKKS